MKQLGIFFTSIFLLFFYETIGGQGHNSQGKSPAPAFHDNLGITIDYDWSCPPVRVSATTAFTEVAGP